jgi:hypothetical protein
VRHLERHGGEKTPPKVPIIELTFCLSDQHLSTPTPKLEVIIKKSPRADAFFSKTEIDLETFPDWIVKGTPQHT